MPVSLGITITQNSQNASNNTSNVTVVLTIYWTGNSYNGYSPTGTLYIDGVGYGFSSNYNYSNGSGPISTSGSVVACRQTVNIAHKSDGTKTLDCSASFNSGTSSGTVTTSASKVLTTISGGSSGGGSGGSSGGSTHTHNYQLYYTKYPTATEQGYDCYRCGGCGAEYYTNYTDPTGGGSSGGGSSGGGSSGGVYNVWRVVNTDALSIREGAGVSYTKVGTLSRGTEIEELDSKTVNGILWIKHSQGWSATESGGVTYLEFVSEGTGGDSGGGDSGGGTTHSHNYIYKYTVPPTATEYGYDYYECSGCDDYYCDNYTEPIGTGGDSGGESNSPSTEYTVAFFSCGPHARIFAEYYDGQCVGSIVHGACVEQGQNAKVFFSVDDGYELDIHTINGDIKESGSVVTIGTTFKVVATAKRIPGESIRTSTKNIPICCSSDSFRVVAGNLSSSAASIENEYDNGSIIKFGFSDSGNTLYSTWIRFTTQSLSVFLQDPRYRDITIGLCRLGERVDGGVIRFAICTSDANWTRYATTTQEVSDEYQLASGTFTESSIIINNINLEWNTTYYIVLWAGSAYDSSRGLYTFSGMSTAITAHIECDNIGLFAPSESRCVIDSMHRYSNGVKFVYSPNEEYDTTSYKQFIFSFTTPNINARSKFIRFLINIEYDNEYNYSANYHNMTEFNYAISASDENNSQYNGSIESIDDMDMIYCGIVLCSWEEKYLEIVIEGEALLQNTNYYLFLWRTSDITIRIKPQDRYEDNIFTAIYCDGVCYIDNEEHQCFIDNGTEFIHYAPYIDDGSKWTPCM